MVSRKRKVIWTEKSREQRTYILDYWERRNKSALYSKKLNKFFREKMKEVAVSPYIGRIINVENVRAVLVRDNLLVYKIFDDKVVVLSVWEGHQNPQNFNY